NEVVFGTAKFFRVDLNRIKMENMFASRTNRRQRYPRNITKASRKVCRVINPPLVERIELAQLDYTDRALNIGQAKIVAAVVEVLPPKAFVHWEACLIQRTI